MASSSAQTNSLIGSLLGKDYRVVEQIGRGGMSVVYLVEHQTLLKNFAAKVLSVEHASSAEARARFAQEAHAASHLDHENIVTISDFGITPDQRPFYVMELLRGQTLMARLEEGPMTIAEVVAVSVPVARALAHAHAEGVIHRDVKPENVFLVQRSQGRWGVKVLDFGIAKVSSNPALTKMGQALGSPMFMAPEACRGDEVDQRADLYSFGILLYLMLTGRVPFEDESLLKVLQMQVSTPLPPPREINPALSLELEAVLVRALEKDPDDRYPTMDALLLDLLAALPPGSDASLHDTPFPAQSLRMRAHSSQRLPLARPQGRKRNGVVALGVIAAVAIGATAYGVWRASAPGDTEVEAPVAAADPAIVPAPPRPPEAVPAPPAKPVEPPAPPVESPVVATVPTASTDPTPSGPTDPTATPVVGKKASNAHRTPEAKRVATAAPKEETPTPATTAVAPATGSAVAAPGAGSAVAVTTAPKELPRVEPPASGSAAPPAVESKPAKPAVAPPMPVGSLDATPAIATLDVNGPLPSSVVRRSVERVLPALRECYRVAAKARGTTAPAKVSLTFEIDESSAATNVSASASFGSLSSCAKGAFGRLQTQQAPDVGTAQVSVTITFRPI